MSYLNKKDDNCDACSDSLNNHFDGMSRYLHDKYDKFTSNVLKSIYESN